MTTRERRLSYALLALVLVGGITFVGYQMIWAPLKDRKADIARVTGEIEDRQLRIARIEKRRADLEKWSKLSLPADAVAPGQATAVPVKPGTVEPARADLARREYEVELSKTLKAAGFEPGSFTIIPKPPDNKTTPTFANKKPIYTRLLFTVEAKGDLASFVNWLGRFYKLKLLHQIRNLTIQKPMGGDPRALELVINMTIEALVLDSAEKRKTLQAEKPPETPSLLTRSDDQYAMIAGKNLFFGPAVREREGGDRPQRPTVDTAQFVRLDGISSTANGLEATLWDEYHNRDYKITPKTVGGYRIESSFKLGNRSRPDSVGSTFELKDGEGKTELWWEVVRVFPREIIFRDDEAYYALRLGHTLADMKALSREDLALRGIKPEEAKTPAADAVREPDKDAAKEPPKGNGEAQQDPPKNNGGGPQAP